MLRVGRGVWRIFVGLLEEIGYFDVWIWAFGILNREGISFCCLKFGEMNIDLGFVFWGLGLDNGRV